MPFMRLVIPRQPEECITYRQKSDRISLMFPSQRKTVLMILLSALLIYGPQRFINDFGRQTDRSFSMQAAEPCMPAETGMKELHGDDSSVPLLKKNTAYREWNGNDGFLRAWNAPVCLSIFLFPLLQLFRLSVDTESFTSAYLSCGCFRRKTIPKKCPLFF